MQFLSACILSCLVLANAPLLAQSSPRARNPNTTVNETLIGYGRTKQRAEQAALAEANQVAFDADYELKSIGLGGRDDDYYCIIVIRHKTYRPENRRAIDEVTVGYGETMQEAEQDARYKANQMILRRLRSAEERRARQQALESLRNGSAAENRHSTTILDKEEDTEFILQSIRFSGRPDDYQCYIKFEYLVHK